MTKLCVKTKQDPTQIVENLKNFKFEYKQSYISIETYFSHLQSVVDAKALLENSIKLKHIQNTNQSYIIYDQNQEICSQIESAKQTKQILLLSGLYAWCEYTCTNTIFEKQNIEINVCTVFDVGNFLQIKSSQKNCQQIIEIIKSMGIEIEEKYNANIALEYYKIKYEETI